jgi:SAM-dependent methyltransferase
MSAGRHMSLVEQTYREYGAGGFSRWDGTVAFLTRVNALLGPQSRVLNLGAGRGAIHSYPVPFVRHLADMKSRAAHVIGLDIDQAVMENPGLDEALVYDGLRFPIEDASIDLIVSDYVFEHIDDPQVFASEIDRILKPGGWVCARTPYRYSLLSMVTSALPNRLYERLLLRLQSDRRLEDTFVTRYAMNTFGKLRTLFPTASWKHCSYTWSPEPSYHGGSRLFFAAQRAYQWIKWPFGGEVLMVFLQKTS